MAKALFGSVGVADARSLALATEVRRLRARVGELEQQLDQACRANEELHLQLAPALVGTDLNTELLALDEPAYS